MSELVKISVRVPKYLYEKINKIADEEYTSVSEVVREALRLFIERYEDKKKERK